MSPAVRESVLFEGELSVAEPETSVHPRIASSAFRRPEVPDLRSGLHVKAALAFDVRVAMVFDVRVAQVYEIKAALVFHQQNGAKARMRALPFIHETRFRHPRAPNLLSVNMGYLCVVL